jgi:hypothetical protein
VCAYHTREVAKHFGDQIVSPRRIVPIGTNFTQPWSFQKLCKRARDLHLNFQDGNRLRVIEHEFIFFVLALRGLGGNLALQPPQKQTSKTQSRSKTTSCDDSASPARACSSVGRHRGGKSWHRRTCAEGRQGVNETAPPLCAGGGCGGGLGGGVEPEAARCGKTKRLHPWCTTCAHTRSRVSTARHEHRYVGPRQAPDVPDQPGTKLLFLLRSSANCHAKFTLAASGTLHAACGHCRSSAQGPRGAALHRGAPSRAPFCLKETNPFVRCARSVHLAPLETGRRALLRHSRQAAR